MRNDFAKAPRLRGKKGGKIERWGKTLVGGKRVKSQWKKRKTTSGLLGKNNRRPGDSIRNAGRHLSKRRRGENDFNSEKVVQ